MSADITMCIAEACPVRMKCYRHEGPTPSLDGQSYFCPLDTQCVDGCEYFIEVKEDKS